MGRLRRRSGTATDLLKGAIAGAVATGVMDKLTTTLYERESQAARQKEDTARHGQTAYDAAAEKAAGLLGKRLNSDDRHRLGNAVHWSLGIAAGAAYGVLRHRIPGLRRAGGAKFGTTFWAAIDEGLVSVLGLTPPPQAFPFQTHARGLVGHLAFGIVADRTLRVLDAVT
ncbi:MAG: DUF1440 domain-containing protein [Gemmatimonadales bacterium]